MNPIAWFGDRVKQQLKRKVDERMMLAGHAIVDEARRLVPVRGGQLRDSIGFTYRQSDRVLQVHADAPYAVFIEFGTRFMRAQPFLRPAINAADRAFGSSHEMQFPTAPHLKGTKRKGSPKIIGYNRQMSAHLEHSSQRSSQAKVTIRRGRWNGPQHPWKGKWSGRPGPIGPE